MRSFAGLSVQRGKGGHRFCLFDLHEHVNHAVLQYLEAGNGLAELLALLRIVERAFVQLCHHAGRFGAHRDGCFVNHAVDQVDPPASGIAGDRDIFNGFGTHGPVNRSDSRGG